MADRRPDKPNVTPQAARAAAEREERLAAALRANLRRRKDQSRARDVDEPPSAPGGRNGGEDGTA